MNGNSFRIAAALGSTAHHRNIPGSTAVLMAAVLVDETGVDVTVDRVRQCLRQCGWHMPRGQVAAHMDLAFSNGFVACVSRHHEAIYTMDPSASKRAMARAIELVRRSW